MVSIKALGAVAPADLWREVPLEEEFWEEARERQRRFLVVLVEGALEEEQWSSWLQGPIDGWRRGGVTATASTSVTW